MAAQHGSHLAAISPYFNVFKQPSVPSPASVTAAIYLFRHGTIEVSGHDYHGYIAPFLRRLQHMQQATCFGFTGALQFLNQYHSWITEAHVGTINQHGLRESLELGHAFRQRYHRLVVATEASVAVLSDSAARCHSSATAFATAFSGTPPDSDGHNTVVSIDPAVHLDPRTNLSWHTTYADADQTAGQQWMDECMQETTAAARDKLQPFCPMPLTPTDVYAMQLLHCYDTCSGRPSPWMEPIQLFTEDDWEGFEYLRDGKYYFSEGPGAKTSPASFALPWFVSALDFLKRFQNTILSAPVTDLSRDELPLQFHFTHREEVLYLCTLLGLGCYTDTRSLEGDRSGGRMWSPGKWASDKHRSRPWHVSLLACYLGHVGIEILREGSEGKESLTERAARIRFILNGNVVKPPLFSAYKESHMRIQPDINGSFNIEEIERLVYRLKEEWKRSPPVRVAVVPERACQWICAEQH